MSNPDRILMIVTSQATMGDDPRPTGVWFEELTTPYYVFADAGADVDIARSQAAGFPSILIPFSPKDGIRAASSDS